MTKFCLAIPLLAVLAPSARADVLILVAPSVGPNVFNSPSYGAYRDNSLTALGSGAATAGTPGTPAFYQAVPGGGSVPLTSLVVTDFPSWLGRADPATAFGSPFGAETGTRLYFGLAILPAPGTPATPFRISDLAFQGTTTDPNRVLDFGFAAGEYEYSDDYVGLLLNPDGTVRQRVTSGPNTQLVDALLGRGSSNAFEVLGQPGVTNQQAIDQTLPTDGFTFTGTYTLGDRTGSVSVSVTAEPIPTPPALLLFAVGAAGLALRRAR